MNGKIRIVLMALVLQTVLFPLNAVTQTSTPRFEGNLALRLGSTAMVASGTYDVLDAGFGVDAQLGFVTQRRFVAGLGGRRQWYSTQAGQVLENGVFAFVSPQKAWSWVNLRLGYLWWEDDRQGLGFPAPRSGPYVEVLTEHSLVTISDTLWFGAGIPWFMELVNGGLTYGFSVMMMGGVRL